MRKIFGCLLLLVLVIIAILLFAVVRNRQDSVAQQQQPVTQQQQPVTQQQSSNPSSTSAQPTIRIVSPANGARVRVGQPFQVHVIANDSGGVASIAYALDGQQGSPVAASSTQAFETAIPITAQSKGIHAIAVQANNAGGAKSQPAVIRVVAVQSLSDPTNSGDPPAPIPDVPTDPVSPNDNQSAPVGATVNFAANPTSIAQGQCSTLRWDVEGVREIYFEGVGVTGHEQQQECPTQTTTYTLGVVFQDGSARNYTAKVDVTAVVVVTGKPDLVITDAHIEPAEATAGQPFNAIFTIENRGDVASGPFTVFWQFHDVTGLKNCCSREFTNGIAGKGWGGGTFPNLVTNSPAGTSPSWVEIDNGNRVDEGAAGEANNKVSLTLTVKASGDGTNNAPPTNLQTTVQGSDLKMTWGDATGEANYVLMLGNTSVPLNANVTSYVWQNPTCGQNVTIVLLARTASGAELGRLTKSAMTPTCTGTFAVTDVIASVTPTTFTGVCPKDFAFTGRITVNGTGSVTYRWERSDGEQSPTLTLTYPSALAQTTVPATWKAERDGTYWMRLHVLTPNDKTSERATFTVDCTSGASQSFAVTKVTANVNPEIFSGTCPKTVNYSGVIAANGPGTVTYKWVRSDGEGEARTINFTAAGSQTVTSGNMTYGHSATYWAKLQVTAPNAMISDQAKFTLSCTSPAIVTLASVSINPTAFTGTCPHTFHFTGVIRTNAPGTVTYRWERSNGNSETRTLNFSTATDQTIEGGDFKGESSSVYWALLHVLTPNDKISNQATFKLTCK
ncbi:hypothetical protein ANRL1_01682 [Anaerolineae bacterium]|nr:hypothetical protein ANRL1_01682 [Anaerolineae bacterium]